MTLILWEFRVLPDRTAEFESAYGPDGDWSQLFSRARGYRGTDLLVDPQYPGRYVTVDKWESLGDFEQFKTDHQNEYSTLDRRCEQFMAQELFIGTFVTTGD